MSTNWNLEPSETGNVPFPSDNLRPLYALCEKSPALANLFEMPRQIHLVIDSNAVFQELIFVTRSRRKASARTDLREALDSGLLVTIAPTEMHEEVNRHIPRLALQNSVPEEKLREAWEELQRQIEFRDVDGTAIRIVDVADVDDIPFVTLYLTSGADAVLTEDKHISRMGAQTVPPRAMRHVRDYARRSRLR